MMPYKQIKSLLPKLPYKLQVSFALYCAKDVFHLVRDKDKDRVKTCIDTVELWLKGKATAKECQAAADASYASAYAADHAIHYTAHSAANAIYYTANAINTAYTASYAAYAAYYSAYAAAKVAANTIIDSDKAAEKYLAHLNKMIKDLTPIEKVLFNMELK